MMPKISGRYFFILYKFQSDLFMMTVRGPDSSFLMNFASLVIFNLCQMAFDFSDGSRID